MIVKSVLTVPVFSLADFSRKTNLSASAASREEKQVSLQASGISRNRPPTWKVGHSEIGSRWVLDRGINIDQNKISNNSITVRQK